MNWLFESPVAIAALGVLALVFAGVAWAQTGRNAFLILGGVIIAITIGLLALEKAVVTDGEAVTAKLYEIAADLERNDSAKLVGHIVQSRTAEKARAASEMKMHHFRDVTIGKIHHIELKPNHQPPEVDIEFNVSASGDFFNGQISRDDIGRWVRLVFWKEDDGQWRIADYEHNEPTHFMRNKGEVGQKFGQ